MELRSRSRSKTPFQNEFVSSENYESTTSSSNVIVTRSSSRKSTSFKTTSSEAPTRRSSKLFRTMLSAAATSDYSSEEGGDYSETLSHISQNEKNQIIEDAKAAANGTAEISALNLYRKAGRYWDKYPKTDYTYSLHSRDRVEIAPGVVQMPNMSRPSIHCGTNTDEEEYRSRVNVKQKLFTSNLSQELEENQDEGDFSYKISRKQRTSKTSVTLLTRIFTFISLCFYSVWNAYNSVAIYMMKKFHRFVSRIMLIDTWLLMKKTSTRKRTRTILWLCLLPLLFFIVLWLLASLCSAIYASYFGPSTSHLNINEINVNNKPQPSPQTDFSIENLNMDLIVEQVLKKNPQFSNTNLNQKTTNENHLEQLIAELKEEIVRVKHEMAKLERSKTSDYERLISDYRSESARNIAFLTQKLNRCCQQRPLINLEPTISRTLAQYLNDPDFLSQQKGLNSWLNSLFLAKNMIEVHINNLTESLRGEFHGPIEATAQQVLEKVTAELRSRNVQIQTISEEDIEAMIKKSLKVYDADKTGLVDYALEPLGGQIVTTRCTETFSTGSVLTLWGLPLWYPVVSPRTVITPGIHPGQCWAFQGFPGFLVIKLAYPVLLEAVSIEHVSELVVPEGRRDSAPRNFELFGLADEEDKYPVEMGAFTYDLNGDTIQYFRVDQKQKRSVFQFVEVRISSNHGNPTYTCLYRFRVHGKIYKRGPDEIY